MITSGLVVTLSKIPTQARAAIAAIHARAEFTLGELADRWLPLAMEAADEEESERLHDWLRGLEGIEFVDVVHVSFDEQVNP